MYVYVKYACFICNLQKKISSVCSAHQKMNLLSQSSAADFI